MPRLPCKLFTYIVRKTYIHLSMERRLKGNFCQNALIHSKYKRKKHRVKQDQNWNPTDCIKKPKNTGKSKPIKFLRYLRSLKPDQDLGADL